MRKIINFIYQLFDSHYPLFKNTLNIEDYTLKIYDRKISNRVFITIYLKRKSDKYITKTLTHIFVIQSDFNYNSYEKVFEQLYIIIGCKKKTFAEWDEFFKLSCLKTLETNRNTKKFYTIREEYFIFRELIKQKHLNGILWEY